MRTGVLLAVVLLASCGGGNKFTPATPPASTCALLTLDDIAPVFPDAMMGGEYPISDTTDLWMGDCFWLPNNATAFRALELTIYGAKTFPGLMSLALPANPGTVTRVTGLGTAAQYWEQPSVSAGLWAFEGASSVTLTAYSFMPSLTADQLRPLVAKVLGGLE